MVFSPPISYTICMIKMLKCYAHVCSWFWSQWQCCSGGYFKVNASVLMEHTCSADTCMFIIVCSCITSWCRWWDCRLMLYRLLYCIIFKCFLLQKGDIQLVSVHECISFSLTVDNYIFSIFTSSVIFSYITCCWSIQTGKYEFICI